MAIFKIIAMVAAIIAGTGILAVAIVFAVSKLKARKAAKADTPANPEPAPANPEPKFPTRRTLVNVEVLKSLDKDIAKADEAAAKAEKAKVDYADATAALAKAIKDGVSDTEQKELEAKVSKAKSAQTKAIKAAKETESKKAAALERRSEICSILADEVVKYCAAKKN